MLRVFVRGCVSVHVSMCVADEGLTEKMLNWV